MSETPKLTCEWCGKEFDATPDAFVESGYSAFDGSEPDEADDWKGDPTLQPVQDIGLDSITESQAEEMKSKMGLNDAQLKELLTTGSVENGASIVCIECQDSALEQSEE